MAFVTNNRLFNAALTGFVMSRHRNNHFFTGQVACKGFIGFFSSLMGFDINNVFVRAFAEGVLRQRAFVFRQAVVIKQQTPGVV